MNRTRGRLALEFPDTWWRMKILTPLRPDTRELWGTLTDRYDLRSAYEKAHARKDPLLAPHGFFRKLAPKNVSHAREFLQTFGPLFLDSGPRLLGRGEVAIDLDQFWALHLRFSLVSNLWESLHLRNRDRLSGVLSEIFRRRREFPKERYPLGTQFGMPTSKTRSRCKFPWQQQRQKVQTWLRTASLEEIRQCALSLVHLELNAHTRDRQIGWQKGWERSGEKFRLEIWIESLWSAIWEFFGTDTAGIAWRRCPHCQQLFYPRRRDQFYCTPRQQALASKRRYATERRARERRQSRRVN